MGDSCRCLFSTVPGKELVCAERGGHRGPHQAHGVTWTQLFGDQRTAAVAAPPDLAHAIQAAAMLRQMAMNPGPDDLRTVPGTDPAAVALRAGADALEQLQATRDRLADLQGINATIGNDLDQANAKLADYRSRIESLCDQLADLQVYAAELHDLLQQVWELHGGPEGAALWVAQPFGQKIGAALQVDPPARGRAILEEVERSREAIQEFLIQAPTGLRDHSSVALLRAALDLGAAQEEDRGE